MISTYFGALLHWIQGSVFFFVEVLERVRRSLYGLCDDTCRHVLRTPDGVMELTLQNSYMHCSQEPASRVAFRLPARMGVDQAARPRL